MAVFGRVLDGLSGLAGIFINCIYAGCGNKSVVLVSTPVYRKFEKPVPTRQPVKLSAVSLCLFEGLMFVNQVNIVFFFHSPLLLLEVFALRLLSLL